MNPGNRLTLDCIIFGLQRFGGISNYWAKLVDYASVEPEFGSRLVIPKHLTYRDFDAAWMRRVPILRETLSARVARYLRAPSPAEGGVFHTSYYRLPRRRAGKYVVTVYDFTYERYGKGLPRLVHSWQKLASIRRADAVLCISESTRRDLIEFCPEVEPTKLHVVYLGVDSGAFFRGPGSPITAHEQTVLFVGQRVDYKRFDLAVEAVRQSPRLSLGVIGPPLTPDERTTLIQRLGNRWQEFGPIATADLRLLYSSAFAFIFPSDYEGFGLPVLEAMACGCPVVCANTSSLPEVGGSAAHYASRQDGDAYAEALQALETSSVAEQAVHTGMLQAAKFNWSQTLQQTANIYAAR